MTVTHRSYVIRTAVSGGSVVVAAALLAACSTVVTAHPTSLAATTSPAAPTLDSAASSSSSAVGGNPGTWTPLTITASDNGKTIVMVPDQVALLEGLPMNDGEDLNVDVTDESVATFERAEGDSSKVSAAPAIIAKAPGTTDVVFTYDEQGDTSGANVAFKVTITVKEQ
jgi:hypothetical protein